MESEQINKLISELRLLKEQAFSEIIPNAPEISLLINKLNSISKNDKPHFLEFAKELKEEIVLLLNTQEL